MAILTTSGWSSEAREQIERVIRFGAGKRLPVAVDFDNTLVCGDIGEATLAMLVRDGTLRLDKVPPDLVPPFALAEGELVSPTTQPGMTEYYEALLDPTSHGPRDPTPLSNGYVWAVETLRDLPLRQVVEATEKVWALSAEERLVRLEVSSGGPAYPVPFFYPEMVELLTALIRHEFDIWIVSASNVWSVRWVVTRVLNPRLTAQGAERGITPDHVIGVSTLLSRSDGTLCKDAVLVCDDPPYAALVQSAVAEYRLTRWLQFPVPTYSGKIGAIWDAIGRAPYLGAGDSPGDLPMLSFCEHRLWIDRFEKLAYRQAMERTRLKQPGNWIVQPVRTKEEPRFLAS
jgi:phosphoserine phosphatase